MNVQAMSQMKDMKPDDWERAKQQMAGMDGDTMARQAAQAQQQMAGRTQYVLNVSIGTVHGLGKVRIAGYCQCCARGADSQAPPATTRLGS